MQEYIVDNLWKGVKNMCIKIGSKIELSEELKNVSEHYAREIADIWSLIMSAHASIIQESNKFWDIIRKEHPELNDYEMSYDNGKLIVICEKRSKRCTHK